MMPDHYATLGLSPTSDQVVVRAAYLALMRRYHPDNNPSEAAAERTRAINDAYAVLGDPERRADYDTMRSEEASQRAPRRRRPPPTGLFAAAAVVLLLLLLPLALQSPLPIQSPADQPREAPRQAPVREEADAPAPVPEAPPPAAPQIAESAAIEPLPPQLDRAQPVPVRPAPVPAARPVVTKPATTPTPVPPTRMASATPTRPAPRVAPAAAKSAAAKPATAKPAAATASQQKPSFNCSIARTRGEIAVCGNANLATLDRQQALIYSQSWARADAAKRAKLLGSREKFIARRDACSSSACTSAAYLARMREVSEIMTAKPAPAAKAQPPE